MTNGKSKPFFITVFLNGHSHHFRPTWIRRVVTDSGERVVNVYQPIRPHHLVITSDCA